LPDPNNRALALDELQVETALMRENSTCEPSPKPKTPEQASATLKVKVE